MRLLLDAHVWLWWLTDPARLNSAAIDLMTDRSHHLYLSAATVWEVVIKHSLGKLDLPSAPDRLIPAAMAEDGLVGLPIEHPHVLRVGHLPPHHRDPFDRVLVAQAQVEGLTLLTADPQLAAYDVQIIRAA